MVTPGTPIAPSTSIDALFSALFPTRSSDLGTTPNYLWVDAGTIEASWPGSSNAMYARLEARPNAPSVLAQSGSGGGTTVTDSISAVLGGSFVIPAVGSGVTVTVAMPWADAGDTVSVNDGTHQFKGTVLANTGTTLTLLNSGYAGNTASGATMAASATASLCDVGREGSDFIAYQTDFVQWELGGAGVWADTSSPTAVSYAPWQTDHQGIMLFQTGTTAGNTGAMLLNTGTNALVPNTIKKMVMRFVLKIPAFFTAANYGEFFWGLSNSGTPGGTLSAGALMSVDVNFASNYALICGNFDSGGTSDVATSFIMAPNTWYDCIISFTPTSVKYYIAAYGSPPQLVATSTTHIPTTAPVYVWISAAKGVGGSTAQTLLLDRYEHLIQLNQPRVFLGDNLVQF